MSESTRILTIPSEPFELNKLLKKEKLVMSGGEAKIFITNGDVLLNGEVEERIRKKIYSGDTIHFQGEVYQVMLDKS